MKKSRFYYSTPSFETTVIITTDDNGEITVRPKSGAKLTSRPRMTICGILDTDTNTMSFGVSLCSAKDKFVRKVGKQLSEERAINKPILQIAVTKENTSKMFIQSVLMIESNLDVSKYLYVTSGK